MSRRIAKLPEHVYFVIGRARKYDGSTYETVDGPYSTLSAAKGKRTNHINYSRDKTAAANRYTIVESPAGEWKEVVL